MTRRIAMWSGPRNISTAMMRAFENRTDTEVVDEPFYAAYLDATGSDHPGRDEILESQPRDWRVVADDLCRREPANVFYQKHMTQHILPAMDMSFTESLVNCFLIRDPRSIIASYAKVRPTFVLEELGFPQQEELFDRECDRLGEAPPVLEASLTLQNPRSVLTKLCARLGIAFEEGMLSWPAGPRATDGVWAPHWYSAVLASTGFAAPTESSAKVAVELTDEQEALSERAEAGYRRLAAFALKP